MVQFATRLKKLRTESRFTMQALADKAGVSKSMISKIESHDVQPTLDVASRLAVALETNLAEMLQQEEREQVCLLVDNEQPDWIDPDSKVRRRVISPSIESSNIEWLRTELPTDTRVNVPAFPKGTHKYLVVRDGALKLFIEDEVHQLKRGDSLYFAADRPHEICNAQALDSEYFTIVYKQTAEL